MSPNRMWTTDCRLINLQRPPITPPLHTPNMNSKNGAVASQRPMLQRPTCRGINVKGHLVRNRETQEASARMALYYSVGWESISESTGGKNHSKTLLYQAVFDIFQHNVTSFIATNLTRTNKTPRNKIYAQYLANFGENVSMWFFFL